jgi:2-dehydro-3-deoxygluconokinase
VTRLDVLGVGEPMALFEAANPGPLERSPSFVLRLAGAEVNLLIGVARQGRTAALLSAVGDDPFGRFVVDRLRGQRVDVGDVRVDPRRRTGVFFKELTGDDRRRVYYYRDGSAASALDIGALEVLTTRRPRVLTVSGLTLGLGEDDGLGATARSALRLAHERGTTTVFDANLRPGLFDGDAAAGIFDELCPSLDLVLAGRDELTALVPGKEPIAAAESLLARGCRGVVVKDGARGSTVVTSEVRTEVPPLPVADAVDPVGAGDAFGAGVVVGHLRGWTLPDAARLGSVLGGRVVQTRGDWEGIPDGPTAERLLASLPSAVPVEVGR